MTEVEGLKAIQLDALKEVANIGAGHAATALSQLTNHRVMVSVPELKVCRIEDIPEMIGDPEDVVTAVLMHMLGDLTGRTLLILPELDARRLCDLLIRKKPGTTTRFDELEQSSLKEAGNILGGAYMNALSEFMGMMLLPSVPSLEIDLAGAVLTSTLLNFSQDRNFVLSVETEFYFNDDDQSLRGFFLLLPDRPSLTAIFNAIRVG